MRSENLIYGCRWVAAAAWSTIKLRDSHILATIVTKMVKRIIELLVAELITIYFGNFFSIGYKLLV